MRHRLISMLAALTYLSATAHADDASMGRNVHEMKLAAFPGMPTCATGSVQNGDPSTGASIIFAKMKPGCVIPWHWHTPNEHLMIVSGTARMDMKDMKPLTLRPGAFARMPGKHAHQFSCSAGCSLYVYSDGAFDIHYLDEKGQEITPEVAMKAVKQKAAPMPPAPK